MNDYFENYKNLKKEVSEACDIIKNNNSSKLKDELENLKKKFDNLDIKNLWDDKVGIEFQDIIKICSNNLNNVITNIESNFTKGEILYKTLNEKLNELENINNQYQEAYKLATTFVSSENYKRKTNEEIKLECENIDNLENKAIHIISEIEDIKKELLLINEMTVDNNYNNLDTVINVNNIENNVGSSQGKNQIINGSYIQADSEQSVIQLANMCMAEQGSPEGAKFELSLLINQFKSVNGREPTSSTELSNFMQNFGYGGGHWYAARTRNMANIPTASDTYINAIQDVLNGNRVLPSNVVEHDCFSDIAKIVVNGQTLSDYQSIRNHANYIKDNTVIYNKMGSVYTFYEFAPNGGDPFGYF